MFFLSLIAHVKTMNSSNKLNFQIGVMQLLKSYTEPQPNPNNPQRLSFTSPSTSYSNSPSDPSLQSSYSNHHHSPIQARMSPLTTQPSSAVSSVQTEFESEDSVLSFFQV
jgi:hypothetical protein